MKPGWVVSGSLLMEKQRLDSSSFLEVASVAEWSGDGFWSVRRYYVSYSI